MRFVDETTIKSLKNSLPLALGLAIKERRHQLRLTQTELGDLTHKDRQYIYKIEKGKVSPNIVTIGIIAVALELSISELLKDL